MNALYESVASDAAPSLEGGYSGRISRGASTMDDKVWVVIAALSTDREIGPCRWQARDDTSKPARGDRCFVQFDDNQEAWVIAWWPFNT
jgi:hypothetical protein